MVCPDREMPTQQVMPKLSPLQALTGKRTYQWGDEQEKAFDELRNAMVRAPVLALPNATDPFCPDRKMPTQQVMPKLSREPNYC
jgi:hypothetical protein